MKDKLFAVVRDCCKFDHCTGKTDLNVCKHQCTDAQVRVDIMLSKGVIVPPVPVGGKMYTTSNRKVREWKVYFIGMNIEGEIKFHLASEDLGTMFTVWEGDIGKIVFLTEEDAINELKERKAYEQ